MKRTLYLFFVLAFLLAACGAKKTPNKPAAQVSTAEIAPLAPLGTPAPKYGDVARALMRDFSNIGPRPAGSQAEIQAAQYISQVFQAIGYAPESQAFTAEDNGKSITSANVVALKKGVSAQEIIVGAAYDSTDKGPGADQASGVAVMLEVARMLTGQTTPYTIRFIAFGAEHTGLMGAYAYLNQMSQEEFENVVGMVDLDQLTAGNVAYAYGEEGSTSSVRDWAAEWAAGNGLAVQVVRNANLTDPKTGKGPSAFSAFRDVGIPYVFFQSADWSLGAKNGQTQVEAKFGSNGVISGTGDDTLDYLDKNFPGRVDERLNMFVTILSTLLTQYEVPLQ
jgi:Zn-dependent M28 family amino/carboxypeptidase